MINLYAYLSTDFLIYSLNVPFCRLGFQLKHRLVSFSSLNFSIIGLYIWTGKKEETATNGPKCNFNVTKIVPRLRRRHLVICNLWRSDLFFLVMLYLLITLKLVFIKIKFIFLILSYFISSKQRQTTLQLK